MEKRREMRQGMAILLGSLISIPVAYVVMGLVAGLFRAPILCFLVFGAWTAVAVLVTLATALGLVICASRPGGKPDESP